MVPIRDSSLAGKTLDGRYELLDPIGAGGVGEVYRARLLKLDRLVAVKVLHEALVANADFVERFEREAKAMSRMHHPHCVGVMDFGMFESRPYLVLEYLPGDTVTKLLAAGAFSPARAVSIAVQLLDALSYFHGQQVIHRDLKSENVMLVPSGATRDLVKVLDFGMAKILDGDAAESQLSKRGLVAGTVSAMAPEQIQQLRPDRRIDIYATGIMLYEMIVGHRPFRGTDQAAVVKMQLDALPPRPREVLGHDALSAELEQVILRALEKDRGDRFDTAQEMAEALQLTPEGQASRPREPAMPPEPTPRVTVLDSLLAASAREPSPAPTTREVRPLVSVEASRARPRPRRKPRWILRAGLAAGAVTGLVALAWVDPSSLEALRARFRAPAGSSPPLAPAPAPAPAEPPRATSPAPTPTPPSAPEPLPSPAPATPSAAGETDTNAAAEARPAWVAHRDLAVVYAGRGEADDALREVKAAVNEDPVATGADRALLDTAVAALTPHGVPFVLQAFRSNPRLVEALAEATAAGSTRLQRHAALQALGRLRQETRADLVAMRMLDIEQGSTCAEMRTAFNKLRTSTDPRVKDFANALRARTPADRQVRCLRTALRGRAGYAASRP